SPTQRAEHVSDVFVVFAGPRAPLFESAQRLGLGRVRCRFRCRRPARGPAITAKTADLFPGRQLGTILGVITIGSGVGSAVGSWGAGWIYDLSGSYRVAFIASIVSYAAGVIAFWALRRPPARAR